MMRIILIAMVISIFLLACGGGIEGAVVNIDSIPVPGAPDTGEDENTVMEKLELPELESLDEKVMEFEEFIELDEVMGLDDSSTHTIEIISRGFSPTTLTVTKGDTVEFVNNANRASWPASGPFPTRNDYPGSGVARCKDEDHSLAFDACEKLLHGDRYSFTFNEVGVWDAYDVLQRNFELQITVLE